MKTYCSVIVICSVVLNGGVLAAPVSQPAAVYARVIYLLKNPARETDRPEPWIVKELNEQGHTHFMAVTNWVRLGDPDAVKPTVIWNGASDWMDDGQNVVACPGFARIVDRAADGNVNVEIDAFMPFVNQVRLQVPDKLGARTLAMAVKDRIYVALQVGAAADVPATQPSKLAAERAVKLNADIKTFRLRLNYYGEEDKPYYRLLLSVPAIRAGATPSPFFQQVQITEDQARKIIDYLATEGFIDQASDGPAAARRAGPGYTMSLEVENKQIPVVYAERLGWDMKMLHRLDRLRMILDGDAAKSMDFLLTRMAGHRREWEKAAAK